MNEIWKIIEEFNNYEISNKGRVRNTKTGRILKMNPGGSGYLQVCLCCNGKKRTCRVHKLVFEAFNYKVPKGMDINHIDGNKRNNEYTNLECVTHKYNVEHSIQEGLRPKGLNNLKRVYCYETDYIYGSLYEASIKLGLSHSAICNVCKGRHHSTGGYHFKYVTEEVI